MKRLTLLLLAIVIIGPVIAQQGPERTFTLVLPQSSVEVVLAAMYKRPYEEVAITIQSVGIQVQKQIDPDTAVINDTLMKEHDWKPKKKGK